MPYSSLKEIYPFDDPSKLVFLAGSGISVPSGLPSGWEFNSRMAKYLSTSKAEKKEILSLLSTDYNTGNNYIRFEQIIYILRERIDHDLKILNSLDRGKPSFFHYFLAEALKKNSFVFTTNFDSLIEDAFCQQCSSQILMPPLYQIHLENENKGKESLQCNSFEGYLCCGLPQPALFKLHGTIREIGKGCSAENYSTQSSVGATLDQIGARGNIVKLESHKHATLEFALKDRVLCVIGYSGSDDFDVVPSLVEILPSTTCLLWIRHGDQPPEIFNLKEGAGLDFLPRGIYHSCLPPSSFLIIGQSDKIIKNLFDTFCDKNLIISRENLLPLDKYLNSQEPYSNLNNYYKKIIIGRIAEEASSLDIAIKKYTEASKLSLRRSSSSYAYSLFRLGHINRIIGNDANARLYLERSLRIFKRLLNHENTALVLNALGNLFLVRGELKKAENKYNAALCESTYKDNPRLEATILNNIGLIWKKRGFFTRAIEYYNRAFEIDFEIREKAGMMRELGNKVNALILLGEYQEAITICDETVETQQLLGRMDILANTLMSRGTALCHLSRFDEAKEDIEKALKIEQKASRKGGIAQCLSLFGRIERSHKNFFKAIDLYIEAVAINEELGRAEGAAHDHECLGDCYSAIKDKENAEKSYSDSLLIFKKLRNKIKISDLSNKISNIYQNNN